MTTVKRSWTMHPAGMLLPDALVTEETGAIARTTSLRLKQKAQEIEAFYERERIALPPDCSIRQLIAATARYSDAWLLGETQSLGWADFFSSMHLGRIAESVLRLQGRAQAGGYLRRLLLGTLDFFKRTESPAKDALWELEVWSMLLGRNIAAELDEPDVLAEIEGTKIAFACKKVYSPASVRKSLSTAVRQIEKGCEFGIAAYNLDETIPGGCTWTGPTARTAQEMLRARNSEFLQENERLFKRYLLPQRIVSAFVCSSIIADLSAEAPRFVNVAAPDFWTLTSLSGRHRSAADRLQAALLSG